MGRRLVSLTGDNVGDLPAPCRSCVFWEAGHRDPDARAKDDWLSAVLLDWGSCGRLLYVDGELAAFARPARPRAQVVALHHLDEVTLEHADHLVAARACGHCNHRNRDVSS